MPSIEPFRALTFKEAEEVEGRCAEPSVQQPWIGALSGNAGSSRVCSATFITHAHLITTRRCVLRHLLGHTHIDGGVGISLRMIIANQTLSLVPEFVAWTRVGRGEGGGRYNQSYRTRRFRDEKGNIGTTVDNYQPPNLLDSELAIVQLSEHDSKIVAALGVEPVCVQRAYSGAVYEYGLYADRNDGRVLIPVTGYGVTATGGVEQAEVFLSGGLSVQVRLHDIHWLGLVITLAYSGGWQCRLIC